MANIIKNSQQGQTPAQDQKLEKSDFGAKAMKAALTAIKKLKSEPKHDQKSVVELREDETREIIGLSGGSATGGALKSNKQLSQQASAEALDAWTDPTRVDERDDLETAMAKRLQRAESESTEIEGDEAVIVNLNDVEGLNYVSRNIRHFINYHVLEMSPELYIVMGGLSETFDNLLAAQGVALQDPATLSDPNLQLIFDTLQKKRSKLLSEEEKEAELILAGAVGILAIPQILEKLEEMGLDIEDAKSIQGALAQLLQEVKSEDSSYHNMYLLIKEETELSKVENEEGAAA